MKRFFKWFFGTIAVVVILFILIAAIGIIGAYKDGAFEETKSKNNPTELSIEKYGEEYPFTIDNLTLKCENQAVLVEDKALNKYALNGLADGKFQGRGDYKGYTTSILIPNKTDNEILNLGFTFCK